MSTYDAVLKFNRSRVQVVVFAFSLALFFALSFLAQRELYKIFPVLGLVMTSLITSTFFVGFYGGFRINYIGFALPLVISLSLLFYMVTGIRTKMENIDKAFAAAFVLVAAISLITKPISILSTGAGMDVPLLTIAVIWILTFIIRREYTYGIPFAYVMVFLTSALSDVLAIGGFNNGVTFGGLGVMDGDFLLPLATLIAMYIARITDKTSKV